MNKKYSVEDVHFNSYRRYFNSGFYQKRYPRANLRTLKTIKNKLEQNHTILDIGCGDGRYALEVVQSCKFVNALDISEEAVKDLRRHITDRNLTNMKVFISEPPLSIRQLFSEVSLDGVMLIFGVLSHIVEQNVRHRLLSEIYSSLKHNGFLVLSVPSGCRRFLNEQKIQSSSTIAYTRQNDGEVLKFNYKLFYIEELREELRNAGFNDVKIVSESILPETFVVNSRILGWIDRILCAIVPTKWAYGYLVTAIK